MFIIISDRQKAASRSTTNLCLTCHQYRAVRYALDDREERYCVENRDRPMRLRGPVAQCTDYDNKTQPSKWELDKMAWAIEPSKRRVGFGELMDVKFIPPSERKDIEK